MAADVDVDRPHAAHLYLVTSSCFHWFVCTLMFTLPAGVFTTQRRPLDRKWHRSPRSLSPADRGTNRTADRQDKERGGGGEEEQERERTDFKSNNNNNNNKDDDNNARKVSRFFILTFEAQILTRNITCVFLFFSLILLLKKCSEVQ